MIEAFQFDEDKHEYRGADGVVVRSVTQKLNDAGVTCYEGIPRSILERKADIGTAAHKAAWFYDENELDWSTVAPEVEGYVYGWVKFRQETGFRPRLIEQRGVVLMHGHKIGYTLDREGDLFGRATLIEIKCTAGVEASFGPQTAAYETALWQQDKVIRPRVAVHLKPDGSYSLIALNDVKDYDIWRLVHTHPPGWEAKVQAWLLVKGKSVDGYGSKVCEVTNGNSNYYSE